MLFYARPTSDPTLPETIEQIPYWRRPERWLAFLLAMLGVCSFLVVIPVSEVAPLDSSIPVTQGEATNFLDQLRASSTEKLFHGHWTSLMPPLIAVMVAVFFRSLVFALLSAFVAGSLLSFGLNPFAAAILGFNDFVLERIVSRFSLYIFLFLFALVGMVNVMARNGGLEGLVSKLERLAKGPRRAKLTISLAGLLFFFDDYSNTVVVGNTMRKLSDRWRISREKLAYLVDSTTAPVAGIAFLSTWIAFETSLLGEQAQLLGIDESGYGLFMSMAPMRFYCIGTLIFVFMTSALGRDFGPMLAAERRSAETGKVNADESEPLGIQPAGPLAPDPDTPRRWFNAAIPIGVVFFGILLGIMWLGASRLGSNGEAYSWFEFGSWREAFGAAVFNPDDANGPGVMPVLFLASVSAGVVAIALTIGQRILTPRSTVQAYVAGLPTMWMAIFILVMTWSMQAICANLGTAEYLMALLGDRMPLWSLPLFTFFIASAMAFATGTSWGAMGILIPIILPLAVELGAYQPGTEVIFLLTAAAILDGSIMGDHCSPISDTTVLSSISSGCDHIQHVNTQFLYALVTMGLSGLFGYLAVSGGLPLWVFYLCFPAATVGLLFLVGQRVKMNEEAASS